MAEVNERMVRRERAALDKAMRTPSDVRAMTGNPHPDLVQPDPDTVAAHEEELERQQRAENKEPGDSYKLAMEQAIPEEDKDKKKYVVAGGGIALKKGRPIPPGSVVALTDDEARKFARDGRLRPYFADPMDDPIVQAYAEKAPAELPNTVTTQRMAQKEPTKSAKTAPTGTKKGGDKK